MKNQEYSLYNSVERALACWWMMVVLMVVGGLAGWIFHLFVPPIYQAKAVITINMDFQKRQLTQYEEDYAFNAANAIITSSSVMNLVIADAQVKGYSINPIRIQEDFYLERRQSVWELRVRDKDPKIAAALTNIWAQKANDALNNALQQALQVDQLQIQIDGLNNCLAGTLPQAASNQLDCKGFTQEAVQSMLQDRMAELVQENKSSLGIISIMAFGLTELASVPETPVIYGQAGLVLAGAFIGLIVSLWVISSLKSSRYD